MGAVADPGLLAEPVDLFAFEAAEPPDRVAERPSLGPDVFHPNVMQGADQIASPDPVGVSGTTWDHPAPKAASHFRPFRVPLGEWFDEDFDFVGAEGDAFTEALLGQMAAIEKRVRKRKVSDEPNHRLLVRKLAVNGYRAFRWFHPALVTVQLGPKAYRDRGGPWLNGEAMGREIAHLQKAGLVQINPGEWGGASTTFRVTDAFVVAAMNARLYDSRVVHRLEPRRLIRVYRANSDDGELVDFEHDDQSRRWTEQLGAYNAFLAKQAIGLDLSKAETVQLTGRQNAYRQVGSPRLKRPDLTNKSLFRQFNDGGFEAGGRLYGAWWINCPGALRPLITINKEPTVELDFSSCAIRMLYHRNGLIFEGDAYFLEALDACQRQNGLGKRYFRRGVKRLAQALFNTGKGGRPGGVKLRGEESVRPWFTEAEVVAMLREKHASIANEFQSEAWKWLQREDSEIALTVIHNLMERGVVALPIHDSFVVIDGEEGALKKEMTACYLDKFEFEPEIERLE